MNGDELTEWGLKFTEDLENQDLPDSVEEQMKRINTAFPDLTEEQIIWLEDFYADLIEPVDDDEDE